MRRGGRSQLYRAMVPNRPEADSRRGNPRCSARLSPGLTGAGGCPWLCSTLVLSGFHALLVPSGFRTKVQPQRWMTTCWWNQ